MTTRIRRQSILLKLITILLMTGLVLSGCSKSTEETTKKTKKTKKTKAETEVLEIEPEESPSESSTEPEETTVPLDPERVRLAGTYEGYAIQTKAESHPENGSVNDYAIIQEGRSFRLILNEDGTASWEDGQDGNRTVTEWSASGDEITITFSDGTLSAVDEGGVIKVDDSDKYWYFISPTTSASGGWAITADEANVIRGEDYYYGKCGTAFDLAKAKEYFTTAGEAGVGRGWYALGLATMNRSLDQDRYEKALAYYEKAIELGSPYGYVGKGQLYEEGDGVTKDPATAFSLYQQALDGGCELAYDCIGMMYYRGTVPDQTSRDGKTALEYFEKARESRDWYTRTYALSAIGIVYDNGTDDVPADSAKALEYFIQAADEGLPSAACNAGILYRYGRGTSPDFAKAMEYFKAGAAGGHPRSMYELGSLYEYGNGVDVNHVTALEYYTSAMENGYVQGAYKVGLYYDVGTTGTTDYAKAMECFQIAAREEYKYAFGAIASMYSSGHGVEVDYAQALDWNTKGFDRKVSQAACNLGWAYHYGKGVDIDYSKALYYYTMALQFARADNIQNDIDYATNAIEKMVASGYITREQADAALAAT